ncbi:MAG: aKG-HExxH-type peptide beta-hydroxylase [Marivita sp.]|uniref:aKG-HExxH-type peptide beta-hydroxylase n=1 Tax=Marivita sp. TaxID=2003365 RepID=UPI003EF7DA2E
MPDISHDFVDECFEPSTARAASADRRMHTELAASLHHLAEAVQTTDGKLSDSLGDFASNINAGRFVRPSVFRHYFQLVTSLSSGDIDATKALISKMNATPPRNAHRTITHFGHPDADQISLELISDGMRLAPISDTLAQDFGTLLEAGFDLMQNALPELYGEITAIVHEILLGGAPHGDSVEFDGASHYQFWGLLILNPKHHNTPLEIVEVLAHEASHSLLFGLTVDEPLVLNPNEDLFASPLRQDLRPMDGIYHATYVSARMCWAMETLAASGHLSVTDHETALKAAQADRDNYKKGLSVIDAHGELSATGQRILDKTRAWMNRR